MFQNRRKATCILFGRADTSRQNNIFYYAIIPAEVQNIIMMHLLTQSKHCPLHFPKRRLELGGTVDRFQALLPELQR